MSPLSFLLAVGFVISSTGLVGRAQQTVYFWGYEPLPVLPAGVEGVVAIDCRVMNYLVLKRDGTVVSFAWDSEPAAVPAGLERVVAIAAGGGWGSGFGLALKADGTVTAWGSNEVGQATVPAGLTEVVAIAAGGGHSLALKKDGTVVAWGFADVGATTIPAGLGEVAAIAAGDSFSLAVRKNGTVAAWGYNNSGQCNVPAGLTGVVAVAAGDSHSLALKSDGTVTVWGDSGSGSVIPAGLSGVVALGGKWDASLALKGNGDVVGWGPSDRVPPGTTGFVAVAASTLDMMGLKDSPPPGSVTGAAGLPFFLNYPRIARATYTATGLPPGLAMRPESGVITGTPQQTGTWQATIQRNNGYQSRSDNLTFNIGTQVPSWGSWQSAYWPAGSPNNAHAPDADPDGDGRRNLIEFAVGSDPLGADRSDLYTAAVNATGHLQLTMDIPNGRTGLVTWKAQFAGGPAFIAATEVTPVTESGPPGYTRLRFTDPDGIPVRKRFGRLTATLP